MMKWTSTTALIFAALIGAFAQLSEHFPYGVASGDPLSDRVIIWTKLQPANRQALASVSWKVAKDADMRELVQQGEYAAAAANDFTVKVDVEGLAPGTPYYYQFEAAGQRSIIGRTKTAPAGAAEKLRFAVVSCSNYQAGYFNNYGNIGRRDDLDAVIHLGDYIYEYADGRYGDSLLMATGARALKPSTEIVTLEDYRARYALYRRDPDLQLAHQMHPFITVWDDHETANDAYTDGAQNHQAGQGDWMERREAARQAYTEWLPIRGEAMPLYRKIQYGDLAELIMLDTRLEGRDKQIMDITDPELYDPARSMLGQEQKAWLFDALENSPAQWKILGNQVMFADYNVGWAAAAFEEYTPEQIESIFLDIWDGYPAERAEIINFIADKQIDDVVIITGDVHCSFAFDIALRPSLLSAGEQGVTYDPETGEGSVAVEFVTPGITSANFDENVGLARARRLEYQINKPLPNGINPNPHMKYADLIRHGYLILDVRPERVQADWFFSQDILVPTREEVYGEGWLSRRGENRLRRAEGPAE
jgi:alkaline phosphatase D